MKAQNTLNAFTSGDKNLTELNNKELRIIKGGDFTIYYTDSQGYDWEYNYDGHGNLVSYKVSQSMCIR